MTLAKHLTYVCLLLMTSLTHARSLIPPTAIDWLLDCPLPIAKQLDPEVLERTQCGIVTVPRYYTAAGQGSRHLFVTRVGARDPLSREGVIFAQAGDTAQTDTGGTFAIHLASRWSGYSSQAYRTLINRYDVIELSPQDLNDDSEVDQAARDMEFVRAQLGDAQLHYLGNADATRLGNRYGALFPDRVTRMVLVNADQDETTSPEVVQLRLKEPVASNYSGCVNQWVGSFLAYGKQPPPSTRCLDRKPTDNSSQSPYQ